MEDAAVVFAAGLIALFGAGWLALLVRKAVLHCKQLRQQRAAREILSGEDELEKYIRQVNLARTVADLDRLQNERNQL